MSLIVEFVDTVVVDLKLVSKAIVFVLPLKFYALVGVLIPKPVPIIVVLVVIPVLGALPAKMEFVFVHLTNLTVLELVRMDKQMSTIAVVVVMFVLLANYVLVEFALKNNARDEV
tara:strand:+ start:1452 stop:1796 length:345 start_codon:yes stop_codon:yes gene_type:complete